MSNIMAAIGIEQLKRFQVFANNRQQLAKHYDQLFIGHSIIHTIPRDYDEVVPHIYVVRIKGMKNRKQIQQKMLERGIQIGYHYQPNHWLSFFSSKNQKLFPVTESIFPELLSLPLHPDISKRDVKFIASELMNIVMD